MHRFPPLPPLSPFPSPPTPLSNPQIKEAYMKCLAENKSDAEACRPLAKQYLQCRMQRNLMAPQDLKDLGFTEEGGQKAKLEPAAQQQEQRRAAAEAAAAAAAATAQRPRPERPAAATEGFVAGTLRFRKPGN
eukprot:scaffold1.g5432.t1